MQMRANHCQILRQSGESNRRHSVSPEMLRKPGSHRSEIRLRKDKSLAILQRCVTWEIFLRVIRDDKENALLNKLDFVFLSVLNKLN